MGPYLDGECIEVVQHDVVGLREQSWITLRGSKSRHVNLDLEITKILLCFMGLDFKGKEVGSQAPFFLSQAVKGE